MSNNPFIQDMVRLQLPEDMGCTLCIGGFIVEADKDRCIEVPSKFVKDLKQQGLTEASKTLTLPKKAAA